MGWTGDQQIYSGIFTASFPSDMKERPLNARDLEIFVRTIIIEKFATNQPRILGWEHSIVFASWTTSAKSTSRRYSRRSISLSWVTLPCISNTLEYLHTSSIICWAKRLKSKRNKTLPLIVDDV